MRKLTYKIIFLIFILLLAFGIAACHETTTPETFTLSVQGSLITWEAVSDADRYLLDCTTPDGSGYTITLRETTFVAPQSTIGDFLYRVKALAEDGTVLAISEEAVYHVGKGGAQDPILIDDAESLSAIGTGSYTVTFGNTKVEAPIYYKLTSDIDLTGKTFTPIGNSSKPFRGQLDGDGHKISGLSFTKNNTDGRIGFFGYLTKAVVKNLTLENASMTMTASSEVSGNGLEYGLLAAHATDTVFDNCHVTGDIDFLTRVNTTGDREVHVGGMIGDLSGGKVLSCSFKGTVNARYSRVFAGGIIGYALSGTQRFSMGNCISEATVKSIANGYDASSSTSKAKSRAGVLIGSLGGADKISSCVAIGSATATHTVDGTPASDVTEGVFGNTAGSSTINTVPIINLFYSSDSIDIVSGTRSNLGSGNSAYGLTAEELLDLSKYVVGDESALDFDRIWTMGEKHPVLRGEGETILPEDIAIDIIDQRSDTRYTLSMNETFLPNYYSLTIKQVTRYYCGYQLNALLSNLGIDLEGASCVVLSTDGEEQFTLDVSRTATIPSTYFMHAVYGAYSRFPQVYDKLHVINAGTTEEYDFPTRSVTITIKASAE